VPNGDCSASPPPSRVRSTFSASLFGVAWQDAQPPMLNIVRPLSIPGACGGNAEAGTVAGMVSTQSSAQTRATAAAMSVSFRIAAPFLYSLSSRGDAGADYHQLFFRRYFSWQPPQSFLPMLPKAAL